MEIKHRWTYRDLMEAHEALDIEEDLKIEGLSAEQREKHYHRIE
jgi:hypothetical protein